jgi:hypothetical protein
VEVKSKPSSHKSSASEKNRRKSVESQRVENTNMNTEVAGSVQDIFNVPEIEASSQVREAIERIIADCPRAKKIKILERMINKLNDEEEINEAQERRRNEGQSSM